jgi:hypothetical protein
MNWDAVGAIGEWAGAIVVVATLFYLATQVKQSQKMEKAVAQRDLLQRVADWSQRLNNTADGTLDQFVSGLREYSEASVEVQACINAYVGEFIFITEAALNMSQDGFFSDGTWDGIEGAALALVRTPGGAQYWGHAQLFIGHEIVQHINNRLDEVPEDSPNFLDMLPTFQKRLAELDAEESN